MPNSATARANMPPAPRRRPQLRPTEPALRLRLGEDGRLWARRGTDRDCPVQPVRCFPWTHAVRYISLRDDDQNEVALVDDAAELDPASQDALERALAAAGFVFSIQRVHSVEEEIEIRTWSIATREGPRTFQTARDHWPRDLPDGGLLIRDVGGDLYRIASIDDLDDHSRAALWSFVG